MNKQMSVIVTIDGKNGMFRSENSVTLFRQHETKKTIDEKIPMMIKEMKKMLKQGEIRIDVLSMNADYNRYDEYRWIMHSGWNHPTLDSRKFNGHDFGDREEVTYEKESFMFKEFTKKFTQVVKYILGELPEDQTLYGQELDAEREAKENV